MKVKRAALLGLLVCLVGATASAQLAPNNQGDIGLFTMPTADSPRAGQLTPADLQNAIDRLARDLDHFALRDLTLDICRWRVMPIVSTPRSLDLAHLRTALWFHQRQPLTRFVSLDVPQNLAARELGLPV